jgi:hypothetical protein
MNKHRFGKNVVSDSKIRFVWTVWLPLLGLFSMLYYTDFGRYRTINFAGLIWLPYQMICYMVTVVMFVTYCQYH